MKGCRPLTDAEITQALAALELNQFALRDKALLNLGLRAGFRISEILSLKLADVIQNGNFVNEVAVARRHMKGQKAGRTVKLHKDARAAIELWVAELAAKGHTDPDSYLFRSREGGNKPMNRRTAWAMLKKAYRACGMTGKLGTHSMRKTFAKRIYENLGKDLLRTQKAMGHASVTSTAAYLSFNDDEVDDAILK